MPFAQDLIHKLEQGGGMRYLRIGLAVLVVVGIIGGYNWRAYRNLATQEAMDQAQLARNIADGKGYKTLFVRPFSMYLVKRVNEKSGRGAGASHIPDYSQIRTMHPDISNPPVYPLLLAGVLKLQPFPFKVPAKSTTYPPEYAIACLNQLLFFGMLAALFFLTRRLFDPTVAWLATIVLFANELFWRFAVSGLSTMLVMLIFVGLLWCLVLLEREAREPQWNPKAVFGLAALAGALVGVGCLTRYAFGWFILPLVLYLALFAGPRRSVLWLVALLAFAVVIAPWVTRNIWVSGMPFGTATFSIMEGTYIWPENRLARSLLPQFETPANISPFPPYWAKFFANLKGILLTESPRFSGSWVSAFFLAGLLVNFRSPALQRLRYFILFCLPVLLVVQSLGRTQLSDDSPEINSENLLVILAPIVIVYGVSFFLVLLDQLELPLAFLRQVIMGVFGFIVCLPILLVFLPPRTRSLVYPPYHPSIIQEVASYFKEDELLMSDVPWAMAWYGHRQCLWMTRHWAPLPSEPNSQDTFMAINDFLKPINGLYLTPQTMDAKFLSQWVLAGEKSWGNFILDSMIHRQIPAGFPLRAAPNGFLPHQLFLADWERWRLSTPPTRVDSGNLVPSP